MRSAFEALAQGRAINQPRRRLILDTGATLHSMAGAYGNYFGTKFYSTHPKYGAHFYFVLYDAQTAEPLAWMEANHLGQIRTGAASGYATNLLANPRSGNAGRDRLGLSGANASGSDSRGPAHQDGARLEPQTRKNGGSSRRNVRRAGRGYSRRSGARRSNRSHGDQLTGSGFGRRLDRAGNHDQRHGLECRPSGESCRENWFGGRR